MTRALLILSAALALHAVRCTSTPPVVEPPAPYVPPPPPPGDPCPAMCEHLLAIGCAQLDNCAPVCRHVLDSHLTPLDVACATAAPDRDAALRCAGIGCGP